MANNGMTVSMSDFNLQCVLVTGNTATSALTCTGIVAADKVVCIQHFTTAAAIATLALIDLDEVTVGAGTITLSTTDTSADQLCVWFVDTSI